jgi:hypothetical protein
MSAPDKTPPDKITPDKITPKDRLLDLFVFAPVGLALTLAEELPSLVEKGRHRVEGRTDTARVVGQFAAQVAAREASRVVRHVREPEPRRPEAVSRPAPAPHRADETPGHREPERELHRISDTARLDLGAVSPQASNGEAAAGDLAIPAYDTLSASQVVKLLAGLSKEELLEVQAHERSKRHRATILNRVEQLLSDEPSLERP